MKKLIAVILAVLCMTLMFAGCSSNPENPSSATIPSNSAAAEPSSTGAGAKKLTAAGSTSVTPLMETLVEKFKEKNAEWTIDIQSNGSSVGIQSAIEGSAEIGMASRGLKQEEIDKGLTPIEIAIDGIAVIVNNENPVTGLTQEQIRQIYMGEITNWKEVGGADAEITVFSREEGSGTRDGFEELLNVKKTVEKDGKETTISGLVETANIQDATGAVKQAVSQDKNAIGYISLGVLDENVKGLEVDGVAPTAENVKADTYKIWRKFFLCTKGEPTGDTKTFVDYILSEEGQKIVMDKGYITVK